MPQAARLGDPIGHSPTMNWLLRGAVIGAAIGLATVAIVGTGGLAAVAVVGGLVAGGAGIGEMLSTMSWAAKEVTGKIVGLCSGNVFTNGKRAARAHVDLAECTKHPPVPLPIATGSGNVYINGQHAARVGDTIACSAVITDGSANVYIGGGSQPTDIISPEDLVPPLVHTAMLVVGIGAAVLLAGPIVAVAGLALGAAGGVLGGWAGGKVFGEGSDGQKWSMLGGSLIGGLAGSKGGSVLAGKLLPKPTTPVGAFVKGGSPGMEELAGNQAAARAAAQDRLDKSLEANSVVMNSGGDRLIGTMGPARVNNADEFNAIVKDLEAKGVDISYREGQFAYGPAPSGGRPGNIVFDPDSSLSAIKHEYGHFVDDAALGFPGQRYYYENPIARVATERRQYLGEIRTARKLGDTTARRQLIEDYLGEKKYLIDNYYTKPYGSE